MGLLRTISLGCVVLALGACHESSSGGGSTAPQLTNLGLGAFAMRGEGELWAIEAFEAQQGASDLDGDGDANDTVLFLYDFADDSLTNLGLALGNSPRFAVGDVLVAFGVQEAGQGNTDLNGDGDTDDLVLHVCDVRTGVTTNTALAMAASEPSIGLATVAFLVQESAQDDQDLDGDGTTNGSVLHTYDSRTGFITNSLRNVNSDLFFHDHAFGYTTDEATSGADLNGDGDELDAHIFEMYDLVIGGVEQVPLAIRGRQLAVNADDWYLLADELETGLDLNGDGDMDEGVVHEVHPHENIVESLGLTSTDFFGSTADGTDLGLVLQEADGVDRNGDGDAEDWLAVLYSAATEQTFDPGLAIRPDLPVVFVPGRMAFLVDELTQAQDLNGDGDQADEVLHTLERTSGFAVDLGLEALSLQSAGGRLLFMREESTDDWNGDGDTDDAVLFYWDPLVGVATGTGIASALSATAPAATASSILLIAPESTEGDLNGDGDTLDFVYVVHDIATRTNTSLGVAVTTGGAALTADGHGLLFVSEPDQGADLNADGDTNDSVLFRFDLP